MVRIIKNPSRVTIDTNFKGRRVVIKAKGSLVIDEEKMGYSGLTNFLLNTYQFLQDKTPKVNHPIGEIKKARGVTKN